MTPNAPEDVYKFDKRTVWKQGYEAGQAAQPVNVAAQESSKGGTGGRMDKPNELAPAAATPPLEPVAHVYVQGDDWMFAKYNPNLELPDGEWILYTSAQPPSADAVDAARYRWLTKNKHIPWGRFLPNPHELGIDAAIDAAMGETHEQG